MKQVYLTRVWGNDKQSLGALMTTIGNESAMEIFMCRTLELGWHNNQSNVSCIPPGNYICRWTQSNRLSQIAGRNIFTYEVLNVPGRAGIRIHSANFYSQLLGCIALGDAHKDINADGELDVIHSGDTIKKFNDLMGGLDFVLNIK